MKTTIFTLFGIAMFTTSLAVADDVQPIEINYACVGEFDPYSNIYSSSVVVPHVFLFTNRFMNILVQNTSDVDLTFYYEPTIYSENANGNEVGLNGEIYHGAFSGSNSPKASTGALLPNNSAGRIRLPTRSSVHQGYATLKWSTSSCLAESPIIASAEQFYYLGSPAQAGMSVVAVNNGNPW